MGFDDFFIARACFDEMPQSFSVALFTCRLGMTHFSLIYLLSLYESGKSLFIDDQKIVKNYSTTF